MKKKVPKKRKNKRNKKKRVEDNSSKSESVSVNNGNILSNDITNSHVEEQLKPLYEKLKNRTFDKKPEFLNILNEEFLTDSDKEIYKKILSITKLILVSPIELMYKEEYEKELKITNEKDKCSICQFNFYEEDNSDLYNKSFEELIKIPINVILLNNCSDHFFHLECISALIGNKDNFKCPNCSMIYGILIGDMPYGSMDAFRIHDHCAGFSSANTICIHYYFPDGKNYTGTERLTYLPNTKEGREILGLLKIAFDRKLTFTIGTSITTGKKNTTIWNGIHHKTSLYGGPTNFGYPDDTYFNRVREELAAKGVCANNIDKNLEEIAYELLK